VGLEGIKLVEKLQSIFHQGVPLVNAILVAVWLVGTSITLTLQWATVKNSIANLSAELIIRDERLMNRIGFLERDTMAKNLSRWTRENQELWCVKTEQVNPQWKCGDLPELPKSGSMEFWNTPEYSPSERNGG
jgi:hypothetical protein